MTATSTAAESALNLVPGELHDGRATVHVMRGELRVAERDVERAHLARREEIARLDGRLARDGGREALVARVDAGLAVAGERGERLAHAAFGIEPRMRHRHGAHDERMTAEPLDLEPEPLEQLAIALEGLALGGAQVQRHRKEEPLRGRFAALERAHEALV